MSTVIADVIVDPYPKIEQMQCACSSGCCGESDECLNRFVFGFVDSRSLVE